MVKEQLEELFRCNSGEIETILHAIVDGIAISLIISI